MPTGNDNKENNTNNHVPKDALLFSTQKKQPTEDSPERPEVHVRSPEEVLEKEAAQLIEGIREDMTALPPTSPRAKKQ